MVRWSWHTPRLHRRPRPNLRSSPARRRHDLSTDRGTGVARGRAASGDALDALLRGIRDDVDLAVARLEHATIGAGAATEQEPVPRHRAARFRFLRAGRRVSHG